MTNQIRSKRFPLLPFVAAPSAAPLLSNVTALNSTSVLVEWERVPKESRNGIITKYTIYYKDELKKAEGTMVVKPPNKTAIINGLRQQAEYSFWIVAATSKGNGPLSNMIKATTDGKARRFQNASLLHFYI